MYNLDTVYNDCKKVKDNVDLSKFKNSTILITGANGLIGGFLSDLFGFLNDKYEYNIRLFLTSYSEPPHARRIAHLLEREDVDYFSWDCSEVVDCSKLPEKIDYAFFCSGYGQPSKFLRNNVKTSLINVVGLESVLSYMESNSGGSLIFLSTSEIYGNPPDEMLPTPEEYGGSYELSSNRSAYKVSKKLGEVLCKEYNKSERIKTRIARVALTYGPGALVSDQRVLQEFIFKANKEKQIKMLDQGKSIRNYLYISDSVEMLLNIILHGRELVYNVGGDTEPVTIHDLALIIGQHFDVDVFKGTSNKSSKTFAPRNVGLCMKRYRQEFKNYGDNIVDLRTGIANTIKWFNLED